MANILDYIDKMQEMYEGKPSSMVQEPRNMANGGQIIGKPGGIVEPGVMYYGKNVMSGSPAQQAENIRRQNESLKKISELFKKKDYTGLKTKTPIARIKQGANDAGGKLNTAQISQITKAIEGGPETQNAFAKKLGITRKELLEGVEKSKSKISLEKSEKLSKQQLKKIEFQEKLFKEIVDNPNATVDSMMKKFKVDKKYLVSQSSKLLKNVYSQNVSIAKGPEFDLDSRGKATLKSWLPDDFNTTEKFLGRFANIDGFKKIQTENMGILIKNAYAKTSPKKYTDAMKALTEYNNFKNNLPKGFKVDLDHPLSKVFLKGSGVSPDKLLYVTPVNRDFNRGFKMQMGNRYAKALLQGDKTAIKNVRALADKLKINIGNVKGSKLDFGTTKFDTKKNFSKEYMANIKEQTTVADELNKLQKTKKGKQLIKDAGFKSGQIKEVQKITKGVISQLEKLGCGKAAGGRILMSNGGATLTKCAKTGQQKLNLGLTNGFDKTEGELAKKILQAGRGLGSMFALRNLLGPAAVGFTVAAEAGLVGYDMLATGKSFKEAVGSSLFNYALGDKTKIDNKKLRYQGYADAGLNENQIGKISAYENAIDEMNNTFAEFDKENKLYNAAVTGGPRMSDAVKQKQIKNFYDQANKNKALIQDLARTQTEDRLDKALDPMVPALMSDADAKRKAMQLTKPTTVKFGNFMDTVFPKGFLSDTTYAEDRNKAINYMPEVQEYYRGNRFARGGLSGGDTSGRPPESGPMSQGLRSLYKNGRKL